MHTRSTPKFIPDLLTQAAALRPDGYALDFMGRRISYRDLAGRVERVACALQGLGVDAGDRVCLCLPNTPYFVILYFAVLRAGGVVVAMNPLYVIAFHELERRRGSLTVVRPDPEEVAVLQYTGGTTGIPKGASLSHRNLVANALQMRTHDQTCLDEPECVMGVLPMFHVFALTTVLNYSVLTAAEIVLLPRFEIETFLNSMARTRPHRLFAVPTLIGKLRDGRHAVVDDLRSFLQSKLNKIEMPREIEIREALPRTLIGKLSKKELREVRGAP
jgi:long-chain acyl-CoA synthetase